MEQIRPLEAGKHYPICLTGKRACPPEDCGGIWGYASVLEALHDPEYPEHDEMVEWVGGEFDPEAFDLDEVNRELHRLQEPEVGRGERSLCGPQGVRGRLTPSPAFAARWDVLGKLCPRGHDDQGTGQNLLRLPRYIGVPCDRERAREHRQARREQAEEARERDAVRWRVRAGGSHGDPSP